MQAYLAAGESVAGVVAEAGLDEADSERVNFVLTNLIDALAPSNNPLLNPAAVKAALDTGGGSAVAGLRNFLSDMAVPPRVPSMVEPDAFEVGVDLAVTPGSVVLRTPVFELIQYRPVTETVRQVPLLIVPPVINKYYVLDLAAGRSMVEYLVSTGLQVFMISWRNPDARHAKWDLDTYGQAILDAMDATARITGSEQTALAATCSGGIIAAMVAAHLAHIGQQDRIAALTLMVTVLDQAHAGLASAVVDERTVRRGRGRVPRPRLPGRAVAGGGVRLAAAERPDLELLGQQLPARQEAAGVRHPVLERRHHPDGGGPAPRLPRARRGQHAGPARAPRRCSARRSTCPRSTGTATSSPASPTTSAPGRAATASTQLLGGKPRFLLSTSGHIAAMVNPPGNAKARYQLAQDCPDDPKEFLRHAETRQGSWWSDYANWLAERCGEENAAPTELGGSGLLPIGEAPGTYVYDR